MNVLINGQLVTDPWAAQALGDLMTKVEKLKAENAQLKAELAEAKSAFDRLTPHAEAIIAERDALKAEIAAMREQEPVYWQWRRKADQWSVEQIWSHKVEATTGDSEVRALYAASGANRVQG